MQLVEKVQQTIRMHRLFSLDDKVLVALSGGADSVSLLRVLLDVGYYCMAVHCNFHLRGAESDRDEAFVRQLCADLQVPLEVVSFSTECYAKEHGVSIEMAARTLRYEAFEQIRCAQQLDVVAVAHHRDDAVETFLLNLVRGAGINGLKGMRFCNGKVVRPLLEVSRQELLDYLQTLEQPYVTDSTNLQDTYARNKIRLNVLPQLAEINSAATVNISAAARRLSDVAVVYQKAIDGMRQRVLKKQSDGWVLSIPELLKEQVPQTLLFELLYPFGFHSAQVEQIIQCLEGEPGRQFESGSYLLLKDRDCLLIRERGTEVVTKLTLPKEGRLFLPDGEVLLIRPVTNEGSFVLPKERQTLCLDAAQLTEPLTLRLWQKGDRFRPFGMKGMKLVSDYLTDRKLSRFEKERQYVLCHGEDIVWLVGERSDERYRVPSTARQLICISLG